MGDAEPRRLVHHDALGGGLGFVKLGEWSKREGNRCVEAEYLRANLKKRGYTDAHVSQAAQKLMAAVDATGLTLYQANLRMYQLLRYGVQVTFDSRQVVRLGFIGVEVCRATFHVMALIYLRPARPAISASAPAPSST